MSEAKYTAIVDDIAGKIKSGRLKPGDKLPSLREMREQYAVSDTPLRLAMAILRSQGLVDGQPGRGMFVTKSG